MNKGKTKKAYVKKGELSINVVVMAVVALLVLVVLAVILIKNMNKGEETWSSCDNIQGHLDSEGSCDHPGDIHYAIGDKDTQWCCKGGKTS